MMNYTEAVFKVYPTEPGREILMAELAEVGFESFEYTDDGIKGWSPAELFKPEALEEIAGRYAEIFTVSFTWGDITPVNWNEEWEKNYAPVVVDDRCGIRAPFHAPSPALDFDIVIEPKMSFGTAHHSTTALMIRWLLELNVSGMRVLDMGCGTGVLAILAALNGAAEVVAIDNYIWAYENTLENCARNGVADIEAIHGDVTALDRIVLPFDLILANINRNVLLEDMGSYTGKIKPGGMLLMSGFFVEDEDAIRGEALKNGLEFMDAKHHDQWSSVLTRRKTS